MDFLAHLPEHILVNILLRMSYAYLLKFKQMSALTKAILETSQFHSDRIKFKLTNKYVGLAHAAEISIYDPVCRTCIHVAPLPTGFQASMGTQIICVNHKIVLLNLHYNGNSSRKILLYDLISDTWKQGAECPNFRYDYDFACCASTEGSIYTAGGLGQNGVVSGAAVYKVGEDTWEVLPNMKTDLGMARGVFINGMFYVIGLRDERAESFDPNTGVRTTIDNMYSGEHEDVLYALERLIKFEDDVIDEYDWELNEWRPIFYLYRPREALSDKWTPNIDCHKIEIMSITAVEI